MENQNANVTTTEVNENVNAENNVNVEKTFTQSELNSFLKIEREKAKTAILKDLGVSDFDSAKQGLAKYLADVEAQKTDLQKANEEINKQKSFSAQLEAENKKLKTMTEAIKNGVKAECAEDFSAIVLSKVNDENDIETVIKTLKGNAAYSGFFITENPSPKNSGTGTMPNNKAANNNTTGSYGAALAEKKIKNDSFAATQENNNLYFKN